MYICFSEFVTRVLLASCTSAAFSSVVCQINTEVRSRRKREGEREMRSVREEEEIEDRQREEDESETSSVGPTISGVAKVTALFK